MATPKRQLNFYSKLRQTIIATKNTNSSERTSLHKKNSESEMTSDAKNVTDYLKNVPQKRKPALAKLRQLCQEVLKGYEEGIA